MGKVTAQSHWTLADTKSTYASTGPIRRQEVTFLTDDMLDQENPSWYTPILRKYFDLKFISAQYQGEPQFTASGVSMIPQLAAALPGQLQVGWNLKAKESILPQVQVDVQLTSEDSSNDFIVLDDHGSPWGALAKCLVLWGEGVTNEEYSSLGPDWTGTLGEFVEMVHLVRR